MPDLDINARLNEAGEHYRAGRLREAEDAYRAILEHTPDHPGILHNLGVLAAEQGRGGEAIACFDRAIAAEPNYGSAHFNRAVALRAAGRAEDAIEAYRRTVALEPDHYEAHRALAFLWMACARRDRALDHFARTLELRRGDDRTGIADYSLRHATAGKLRHDAAQFRHLAQQRYEMTARAYDDVADEIAGAGSAALTDDHLDRLGESYNTAFHLRDAPELPGPTVNPGLDHAAIGDGFERDRAVWFDGLLTQAALTALQRYLLESTIWFDFTHIDGFLAAYLEDGLACPLILQIADEIRDAFPEILGDHPLSQGWAFKGIAGDPPVDLHADDAAVSINFWITPDQANRDSGHGGLMVHTTPPPEGWRLEDYHADAARIRDFLTARPDDKIIVPYGENRAVLFESRLFHGSDAPDFAPGYENHRINITLLFGAAGL